MNVQIIAALSVAAALAWSNRPSTISEPPEWTLREELRLGAEPGADDDLAGIRGIAVSRDGVVYALGSGRMMIFDAKARPWRRPAGAGDPTLRFPLAFGWLGDTLWVFDQQRVSVALLGSRGDVVRSIAYVPHVPSQEPETASTDRGILDQLSRRVRQMIAGDTTFVALLADRSFLRTMSLPEASDTVPRATMLILPLPGPARPDTSTRSTTLLVRASQDGQILQGLEMLVGPWTDARVPNPYGRIARVTQPFQDSPLVTVTPDGSEVVVVERYGATRPGSATYSLARFDVATWKRVAHRFEYQPSPITKATMDSVLHGMLDSAGSQVSPQFLYGFPSRAAAAAAISAVVRRPDYHTPVTDVVAGADRSVWLRERATGRWMAHTPDGRVAGHVTLPPGSRFLYADDRVIWTAARLPGGPPRSQMLVRYRILRP